MEAGLSKVFGGMYLLRMNVMHVCFSKDKCVNRIGELDEANLKFMMYLYFAVFELAQRTKEKRLL